MALPSFFKRTASKAPAPPPDPLSDEAGPVQAARAQARRRLIGAVVLLAIGVIVFPMLFETQPRPLPHDIPIELPRRDGVTPRPPALPRTTPAVTELPVAEPAAPPASAVEAPVVAEATPAAPVPAPVQAPAPAAPTPEPEKVEKVEKVEKAEKPAPAARATPASAAASAADGKAGRFVVQVGAYTDANTLRDVRAKVEKLGLKTYTQSVDTDAGKRTRVRVGPFATRQEADSASSKLKGAGLPGNVLVL